MASPQNPGDRRFEIEGLGKGEVEAGAAALEAGEGGWKQGDKAEAPPPHPHK